MKKTLLVAACAAFATVAMAQKPVETGEPEIISHKVNPHDVGLLTAGGIGVASPAISNHGGPVMTGTPTVYVIWYGNWGQNNGTDTAAGQQIVRDFLFGLSGSQYFQINTSYTGVSGNFTVGVETTDTGSQGTRLSDSKVQAIVASAISSGRLPKNSNGVYFVLTSSNIAENSGFCTRYCGWHTYGTISGSNIKYSFVGNASRCLNGCAAQTISPNGNAGVDGMISVIAHELEEAVTDPNLNAWYDSQGAENADKCAWTFGSAIQFDGNGAGYNQTLPVNTTGGTRNYLVQRNLSAADSKCYVKYLGPQ